MIEWIIYKYRDNWFYLDTNDPKKEVHELDLTRIPAETILVSFQVDQLLSSMCLEAIQFCSIIDFECLDRQMNGEGRDGARDFSRWTVLDMLRHYLRDPNLSFQKEAYIPFMRYLAECFVIMKNSSIKEWERVVSVEIPVNKVLYAAEKKGIQLENSESLKKRCRALKREVYGIKNRFQLEHQVYQPDPIAFLGEESDDQKDITRQLEYVAIYGKGERQAQARMYLELKKKERDLHCLLCADSYRIDESLRPAFKGFGTISSRIIVKNPSLQNLSKEYRSILNNPTKKYLYLDYSQFEAGILACYCKLEGLKELYHKGTIYKTLGRIAGVDENAAKILFYRFMYGGSINDENAKSFFKDYCPSPIIDPIIKELYKQGYVESMLGNRRRIVTDEKPNWLLNHAIQSNASLIFKYALLEVAEKYPAIRLVLPMHDAALYALPPLFEDVEGVKQCFCRAYQKVFPDFQPIVKQKDFFVEV